MRASDVCLCSSDVFVSEVRLCVSTSYVCVCVCASDVCLFVCARE